MEYPACDELIVEAMPVDRTINSILYLQNIEVRKWLYAIEPVAGLLAWQKFSRQFLPRKTLR